MSFNGKWFPYGGEGRDSHTKEKKRFVSVHSCASCQLIDCQSSEHNSTLIADKISSDVHNRCFWPNSYSLQTNDRTGMGRSDNGNMGEGKKRKARREEKITWFEVLFNINICRLERNIYIYIHMSAWEHFTRRKVIVKSNNDIEQQKQSLSKCENYLTSNFIKRTNWLKNIFDNDIKRMMFASQMNLILPNRL